MPIGVIGIIYESRPNVTVDCAILCLKSGNASILRGGKEAINSNKKLAEIIRKCLVESSISEDAVQLIPTTDRSALNVLLKQDETVQCIIPRGGESLIRFTVENSRVPVIKHCSIYIDAKASPDMAESILINAKCKCFAENLIVCGQLPRPIFEGVELRVDARAKALLLASGLPLVDTADEDFHTEYTDLIISITVVFDLLNQPLRAQ